MTIETIREQLKKLKLKTASEELVEILSKKKGPMEIKWFSELLERELDARKTHTIEKRIKKADFPERTCLEQFNWNFNKKVPREKIEDLHELEVLEKNEIALFLGNAGTGKTHIAISIGIKAAQMGYSVFCTSVKRLSTKIKLAKQKDQMDLLFKQILTSKLWILDDWGVVTMPREVSEEVFDLFDRRKHNSAMLVTSNRDIEEWPQVFSDPVLANAAIDRMFENANICIFEGPSYRMKGRINLKDFDKQKD